MIDTTLMAVFFLTPPSTEKICSNNFRYFLRNLFQVAEKYFEAVKVFMVDDLAGYVPQAWISMAQVKHHHYHALAHYYAGLGLIEQHG